MKKTILVLCTGALVLSTLVSCGGRNDAAKQRCQSALAQAQKYRTFPLNNLKAALANSGVPILVGRGALPQNAQFGTLVIEVDAPLSTPQSELGNKLVTNFYCLT